MKMRKKTGFTLIELLVVIAIIALLIGILLPALRRARDTSRLAVSMSNCRQIMVACQTYRFDKKDQIPLRGGHYTAGNMTGWDTWCYGGKSARVAWDSAAAYGFPESAYARPLNEYLYSEVAMEKPAGYSSSNDPVTHFWNFNCGTPPQNERDNLQLPVYKSPGDRITYQGTPPTAPDYGLPNGTMSSYDDVGTSYHANLKWWNQVYPSTPAHGSIGGFTTAFEEGIKRERYATEFDPTNKFVWCHDQISDVAANSTLPGDVMSEFGDKNKSVMAYLDARVEYNICQRGLMYDLIGQNTPGQRHLGKYTFVFLRNGLPNANTGLYP
jgi:prepilin-type N-terminal cleavage/methylation domain-containing protein